jgi:hypothetical protein
VELSKPFLAEAYANGNALGVEGAYADGLALGIAVNTGHMATTTPTAMATAMPYLAALNSFPRLQNDHNCHTIKCGFLVSRVGTNPTL